MSIAHQCDVCNRLFREAANQVTLDVYVRTDSETSNSWSGVDLCGTCSRKVLGIIGDALDQLEPEK